MKIDKVCIQNSEHVPVRIEDAFFPLNTFTAKLFDGGMQCECTEKIAMLRVGTEEKNEFGLEIV